jgi:hypothetical protein
MEETCEGCYKVLETAAIRELSLGKGKRHDETVLAETPAGNSDLRK